MTDAEKEALARDILSKIRYQTRIERLLPAYAARELWLLTATVGLLLLAWPGLPLTGIGGLDPVITVVVPIIRWALGLLAAIVWILASQVSSLPLIAALIALPVALRFFPGFGLAAVALLVASALLEVIGTRRRVGERVREVMEQMSARESVRAGPADE